MPLKDAFIAELKHESALTKKMLERVPMDKADWKPHEKSMTLGRLAVHVAEIPHWISDIINIDEFDFQQHYKPNQATTSEELLKVLDDKMNAAIADLDRMSDEDLMKVWVVKQGDKVYFNLPKGAAIRGWAFSHQIHHRGQLSVYLRLLDVPVPGMYGPTADESFM
jgi:uncharacterized damage-inducible protein DinB